MKHQNYRYLSVGGKHIDIFAGSSDSGPVIYLNTFGSQGEKVRQELEDLHVPDHTLIAISYLDWDHDMAPWDAPPISKADTPCTGGADDYLNLLTEEIMPRAERNLPGRVTWRALAGYSLAGLFALYAMYHCDQFSRIASMSGSLWFPHFKEYAMTRELVRRPAHLYLSLGDQESRTDNPILNTVQKNTEELAAFYEKEGIDTLFQLNQGNHYKDPLRRTALGISWLLSQGNSN